MTWELDLDYLTIARFTDLVLERSLEHTAYTSWATERMTLEGLLERALYSLRDRSERAAVIDLSDETGGDCLAHVTLERGRAYVRTAGRSVDTLASAKAWLRERYPISQPEEKQEVRMSFWAHDRRATRTSRSIAVPAWSGPGRRRVGPHPRVALRSRRRARAAGEAPVRLLRQLNTAVGGMVADRHASVVSTASTRPLYGRGAGSNPAGGSLSQHWPRSARAGRSPAPPCRTAHTPVAQRNRAPSCDGGGRWFESSRAYRIHSRT